MGKVIPFRKRSLGHVEKRQGFGNENDAQANYPNETMPLHTALDQLAELDGFAQKTTKRLLLCLPHITLLIYSTR